MANEMTKDTGYGAPGTTRTCDPLIRSLKMPVSDCSPNFGFVPICWHFRTISSGWVGCEWADSGELAHNWHTKIGTELRVEIEPNE